MKKNSGPGPSDNQEAQLGAEGLACERGGQQLFSGLGFSLGAGSLLRVRGRNGSGKTSLLRIVAGLTLPARGSVLWRGTAIGELGEAYGRDLLYLGHAAAIKDELTVRENLEFSARLAGLIPDERACGEALERLGIASLAALPARFLSQGQRKRAALARIALPGVAPLWLLDEPFAALDDDAVERVCSLAAARLASGGIVVLTSHQEFPIRARAEQSVALGD